jgi:tetratricopeptide (TPR) repeat protein
MGNAHRAIQTTSVLSQREFDLGLDALYAFNFDEAAWRFAAAFRNDPQCAMCMWGYAYALGPNINASDRELPGARAAAERAVAMAKDPVELALAKALVDRYVTSSEEMAPVPPDRRDKLSSAYADAMHGLAQRYPADIGVQVACADALLVGTPRATPNWDRAGAPSSPRITEAKTMLEHVLAANPDHVGAIHFYIHAVDGGPHAALAAPYADRIGKLAPGAGHLVHMSSHIYIQIGRYAEAEDANVAAMAVDHEFVASMPPGTEYEGFTAHPAHFLWHVVMLEGKRADSLHFAEHVGHHLMAPPEIVAGYTVALRAQVAARFGLWDEALALPTDATTPLAWGSMHFARGLAFVAKKRFDEAAAEIPEIRKSLDHKPPPPPGAPPPPPKEEARETAIMTGIMETAALQLEGTILFARGDRDAAIAALEKAVAAEAAMPQEGELKAFPLPARQRLGALLLAAGRAADAERVYREDLAAQRETGWSLFGLATALDAQHRPEAGPTWERFRAAWRRSDIKLTASVVM